MNVDNTEEFRLLSLCSGYAGIELGLRRVVPNLRTVAYVEVEAFAVANLVSKMEAGLLDAAPIWTDIKTFNGWPFRKNIHIITAGYPCQPFSVAGKRQGKDDPRHLWPHIERIIEAVQPVWFFGENVSGHLTLGFPTVYRSLRNLGYAVEAGLFTATECDAPHRRERLFILAKSSRTGAGGISGAIRGWDRPKNVRQENRQACSSGANTASQLADSTKFSKRKQRDEKSSITRKNTRKDSCRRSFGMWPARPGQPQYEWEEPRVVDNTLLGRHKQKKEQIQTRRNSPINTDKGQAQSRLGRAVDGTASRVDRLRLLGNGVVPQQAEKAFRTLMELFV